LGGNIGHRKAGSSGKGRIEEGAAVHGAIAKNKGPISARNLAAETLGKRSQRRIVAMSFVIQGLDPALFGSLSDQKQAVYNEAPVEHHEVTETPGAPCRITLDDAGVGETVLLLSYAHHQAQSPYAQSGPIFVTAGQTVRGHYVDAIPPALARRTLSLRGYDAQGGMIEAVIVEGRQAKEAIEEMLSVPTIDHIDAHNATRGCFAARIDRYG
jgi:hypothetical protein